MSTVPAVPPLLEGYRAPACYDELLGAGTTPLPHARAFCDALRAFPADELQRRATRAEIVFRDVGVTFTLTADEAGVERTLPFCPIPRLIAAEEWAVLERGLFQRLRALNAFLWDVHHEQRCLRDGVVPRWVVYTGRKFQRAIIRVDAVCWSTTFSRPPRCRC